MLRIERQFMVMTVIILLVVGVMLSVKTTKDYQLDRLIILAQNYFTCLKVTVISFLWTCRGKFPQRFFQGGCQWLSVVVEQPDLKSATWRFWGRL